jgi:hypothetical protein
MLMKGQGTKQMGKSMVVENISYAFKDFKSQISRPSVSDASLYRP